VPEALVASGLTAAIVAPHTLPLERVTPIWAAAVWLATLALRAAVAVAGAAFLSVHLPRTGAYDALAQWCIHELLPLLDSEPAVSEHPVPHAASLLPGAAVAGSLVWLAFGLVRSWVALGRTLRQRVGEGPAGSTVVRHQQLLVAITGVGRGRIVVSDAALRAMDAEELGASLAHEIGHLKRRHRPMLLAASVFAALARILPGTGAAARELQFELERDADEYAVAHTRDPLALASAICKAASAQARGLVALAGRGHARLRVGYLTHGAPPTGRPLEVTARALSGALVALALIVTASVPLVVFAGHAPAEALAADCHHGDGHTH
jgi:Zn-dependent protease with chaperone function